MVHREVASDAVGTDAPGADGTEMKGTGYLAHTNASGARVTDVHRSGNAVDGDPSGAAADLDVSADVLQIRTARSAGDFGGAVYAVHAHLAGSGAQGHGADIFELRSAAPVTYIEPHVRRHLDGDVGADVVAPVPIPPGAIDPDDRALINGLLR